VYNVECSMETFEARVNVVNFKACIGSTQGRGGSSRRTKIYSGKQGSFISSGSEVDPEVQGKTKANYELYN
jgi:hypothetical protein